MKKKTFNYLLMLAFVLVAGISFTACSGENTINPPIPEEGTDTTKKVNPDLQGTVAKVVLHVYDGHLHGTYGFHQNTHAKQVKYLAVDKEFVYHLKDNAWVADEKNPQSFNVIRGSIVYALTIDYYDAFDNKLNGKYIDNGANKRYQHFFVPENVKAGYGNKDNFKYDGDASSLFRYVYCDTDPWDKSNKYDNAKFRGDEDPLGFKGYFRFSENRVTFDLAIKLMEAKESKHTGKESSASNIPTEEQLKTAKWLPEIKLPINVFMGSNEQLSGFEVTLEKKESDYSPKEHLIIESLAKAFNITFMEAAHEFFFKQNGEAGHNNNGFWF